MIVALCGMDGTGKTTLAQALARELCHRGHKAEVIESFRYVLFGFLIAFVRRLIGSKKDCPIPKNPLFIYKVWPFLALLDHLVQYYTVLNPKSKHTIVICDRYFYDFMISFEYFGLLNSITKWLYLRLVPRSDVLVVLDVPPEISYKREGKHDLEFFHIMVWKYKALARLIKPDLVLDTTKPIDEGLTWILGEVERNLR